jgi:hypothetical protein
MEQMMERLLSKIKDDQKESMVEMKAGHEMMMAKLDTHHERMEASVNAWQKETTACQEATEAYPKVFSFLFLLYFYCMHPVVYVLGNGISRSVNTTTF